MASVKTKFTVGLFVAIGVAVSLIAILWLGMSHYFESGRYYAAYFDESVQGLDKDSPVKYRGVTIGRVNSIGVGPDGTLIEVILKIESDLNIKKNTTDIVARLKSAGITGIMFVELERKKEGEPDLSPKINFSSKYPVVATKPSDIKKLFEDIDIIINRFKSLDIAGISDNLKTTFDNINQAVSNARVEEISSDIRFALDKAKNILSSEKWNRIVESVEKAGDNLDTLTTNANTTVTRIDKIVADNEKELSEAIVNFKNSLKNVDQLLQNGSDLITNTDSKLIVFQQYITTILQNLEKTSEHLNNLTEYIADNPSQLLFGDSPPSRKVEADTE